MQLVQTSPVGGEPVGHPGPGRVVCASAGRGAHRPQRGTQRTNSGGAGHRSSVRALLWDRPRRQALHPGRPGGAPWRGATRCPPSWSAEVGELGQTFPVALVRPVEGDLRPCLLRCHLGQQVSERWEVGAAGHAGQSAGGGGLTRARAVTTDHIVELCANTNPRLKSPSHGFAGSIGLRGARSSSRGARFPARADAGPCGGDRRGLRRLRAGSWTPRRPGPPDAAVQSGATSHRGARGGDAPRKPGTVAASRAVCM